MHRILKQVSLNFTHLQQYEWTIKKYIRNYIPLFSNIIQSSWFKHEFQQTIKSSILNSNPNFQVGCLATTPHWPIDHLPEAVLNSNFSGLHCTLYCLIHMSSLHLTYHSFNWVLLTVTQDNPLTVSESRSWNLHLVQTCYYFEG